MKENKNQLREKAASQMYVAASVVQNMQPSIPAPDQVIKAFTSQIDQNSKWNRRYSFDDNGGGYAGL